MNLRSNQNGFETITLLLGVCVLLAIAGGGMYVYGRHHNGGGLLFGGTKVTRVNYNGSSNTTSPNGIPLSAGSSTRPAAATPSTTVNITAAGIKIMVPESLKDLTFSVRTTGSTSVVTFSTTSLTAAVPACAANQGSGAFDTVTRGSGQYPSSSNGGLIKQYSSFYVAYTLPSGPCAKGMSPANQALADQQAQDFYSTLSTVQSL